MSILEQKPLPFPSCENIPPAPSSVRSIVAFFRKRPPFSRKLLLICFLIVVLSFVSLFGRHLTSFVFALRTLLFVVVSFYQFSLLRPHSRTNSLLQNFFSKAPSLKSPLQAPSPKPFTLLGAIFRTKNAGPKGPAAL